MTSRKRPRLVFQVLTRAWRNRAGPTCAADYHGTCSGKPGYAQPLPYLAENMGLPAQMGFIRAEPVFIYPSLGAGIGYNDNLTGVPDNQLSSAFVTVFPRLRADVKTGSKVYALTYNGRYGHHFRNSDNDVNEHEIVATSNNQFTAHADLAATAFYLVRQDRRFGRPVVRRNYRYREGWLHHEKFQARGA